MVLEEIIELYKALGETIKTSTIRKIKMDKLIESITKNQEVEKEGRETEKEYAEEKAGEKEAYDGNNENSRTNWYMFFPVFLLCNDVIAHVLDMV
jgi:hypothetical protein